MAPCVLNIIPQSPKQNVKSFLVNLHAPDLRRITINKSCVLLRPQLALEHQETEAEYREAFYKMRMELEPYLYGGVDVMKNRFQEPEEDGALSLSDYDRICPFIEMGKSILLAICFDEEIKVTMERIETIRENLTDLILTNAADEIYEDLYSLNDNEPWFYPEFMARHSVFAKTLYRLLRQSEEKHCCGCCKHKGAAHGKGGCSCGADEI